MLRLDLFSLDQLAPEERERRAYLAGNLALAAFIGDANDAEDAWDAAVRQTESDAARILALQESVAELSEKNTALHRDIGVAVDWISSDKCASLERCKELANRLRTRLVTIHSSTKGDAT